MIPAPDLFQSTSWRAPVPGELDFGRAQARRRKWAGEPQRSTALSAGDCYGPAYRRATITGEDLNRWLLDTPLLEHRHLAIQVHARRVTWQKTGFREKAVACFDFVRSMPFRCTTRSEAIPAVQVLRNGFGDGITKSTLMVSMLRSLGIPSRVRFVSLPSNPLHGFSGAAGDYTEHAFTEVLVEHEWIGVDAYVVDLKLGLSARARLLKEGRLSGYAVHMHGAIEWDGRTSAFSQFCLSDPASTPRRDLGAFDDSQQFYASRDEAPQRHWTGHASRAFSTAMINRRVEASRGALGLSQDIRPPALRIS